MTKSIDNMKKSIEIFHLQNLAIIERFYGDLPMHYGASLLSISIDTVR